MNATTKTSTPNGAESMTNDNYRTEYRSMMDTAKASGWTAAEFNARCKTLAEYRMSRYGMGKAEAYCAAATEVVQEEIQEVVAA